MALYVGTSPISAVYQGTTPLSQLNVGTNPALATNILASLPWVAGAATTLTDTGGLARATATGTPTNPRIIKGPFPLTINKTYQFSGKIYERTAGTNCYIRVSLSSTISTNDFYQNTVGAVGGILDLTGQTFTAGQTNANCYIGIIPAVNFNGEYSEIDDNFSMVQTN